MKNRLILAISILFLFFVSTSFYGCGYNTMVTLEESVNSAWAQVENQYQRRSDLVPNLVKTVEGAANFEKSTMV